MSVHRVEHEWYPAVLPSNIELGRNVYIDSSYAFRRFRSRQQPGLVMADGSGLYHFLGAIVTGPEAVVRIGTFTCLNGCSIVAHTRIEIGAFCLIAWRTVVTDELPPEAGELDARRALMEAMARDPRRETAPLGRTAPVVIGDNVWIGFDAVVCGGVTIGRGSIVGCKTIVTQDVPPYSLAAGSPCRVVRSLRPDDTPEARAAAFRAFGLADGCSR